MTPATRLYVDSPLGPDAILGLDIQRAHYLRSVLRLNRGDAVAVFNGADGEWRARIDGLGKGWASLAVDACLRTPTPEPDVWLVFAPIKRARLDFMVEKATELGAAELVPVYTRHTDVSRVNTGRLSANAREAAEQCERLSVPPVRAPCEVSALLHDWPLERRILLCAESGAAPPIAARLAELDAAAPVDGVAAARHGPWAVMVGPEGGFHASELDALSKLPFVCPVGLGPRVLRADTAALTALACWQAWMGDGAARPPGRAPETAPSP